MIKKLFRAVTARKHEEHLAELYRNLIRHEAQIGGQVFGPVPAGVRREFFCLDPHTWIWHEEWTDAQGQQRIRTTRYDVRNDGMILKAQDGQPYQEVSFNEAWRLYQAAGEYERRVNRQLYSAIA